MPRLQTEAINNELFNKCETPPFSIEWIVWRTSPQVGLLCPWSIVMFLPLANRNILFIK